MSITFLKVDNILSEKMLFQCIALHIVVKLVVITIVTANIQKYHEDFYSLSKFYNI